MVRRGPRHLRIFPEGWGTEGYVAQLGATQPLLADPPELEIAWSQRKHLVDRTCRDGRFRAPTDVPEAARTATVRLVEPIGGTDRMCLLMAAWNDHGYDTRQLLADELLPLGIGSLILEIPYYGSRRVTAASDQPIPTVADFARMGLGAVTEGRALLRHFRGRYRLGVSGYSMGGNIGALVGAAAGFPVAIAPLAASHSPGPVFLDGVISNGIQWDALGGRDQEARLRSALSSVSVLRLPAPSWSASAVMVIGRSDGFIPSAAARALHEHWPGSDFRLVGGGHATVLWRRRSALAAAVADSFARIEASATA